VAARQEPPECTVELGRHDVVEDGIDGAVGVDHHATEEHQPAVFISISDERIVNNVRSVGQPQYGEDADDHREHLGDLERTAQSRALSNYSLYHKTSHHTVLLYGTYKSISPYSGLTAAPSERAGERNTHTHTHTHIYIY